MKKILIPVLLLLLGGCGKSVSEEAFAKGKKLQQSGRPGDLEESIKYFKQSIELEMRARNQLVTAYKTLAQQAMSKAGWSMDDDALDKHVRSNVAGQAGVSAISLGLFHTAVTNFREALALTPNDRFLHFYLGVCYAQLSISAAELGERTLLQQQALEAYETALRIDPAYDNAAYGVAIIHLARGQYKQAVDRLLEIMNRSPKETRVYFALARAWYGLKEYGKAESMYRVLLDLLPARSPQLEQVKKNMTILRQMQ